jgi:flagellar hook-associated protein 3 FlgL
MRVSTSGIYDSLKNRLIDIQGEYVRKQEQITTGKATVDRSEDPVSSAEAADIIRHAEDTKQFQGNVDDATSWVIATQNTAQNMVEIMQKANELTVSANNGTHTPEYRKDLGEEMDALIEQLVQLSDAKFGDAYLLGGTASTVSPINVTRTNGMITSYTESGDLETELRKTQINENTVIDYGLRAGGADGILASTAQGVDVLGNLIAIRDDLLNGEIPDSVEMTQLENDMDHVIGHVTVNGVKQQWLDKQTFTLIENREVQVRSLENIQGADLAAAMTELTQLQTTYQATMQMISNTNQLSILNHI